ncbi:MAG: hypothetical protein U0796_08475 [Gemmatales bacterium]
MPTVGTLITYTTYGTWLRGDARGWVEDGVIMPADAMLELADASRLKHPVYLLKPDQLWNVGKRICQKLLERINLRLLALTVETWHVHYVVPATTIALSDIVKQTKETVRFILKPGQPMWTTDFDRRYCFSWEKLHQRVDYVERHNERHGWPSQPWPELLNWDDYIRTMV